jgi:hypothetical protein
MREESSVPQLFFLFFSSGTDPVKEFLKVEIVDTLRGMTEWFRKFHDIVSIDCLDVCFGGGLSFLNQLSQLFVSS